MLNVLEARGGWQWVERQCQRRFVVAVTMLKLALTVPLEAQVVPGLVETTPTKDVEEAMAKMAPPAKTISEATEATKAQWRGASMTQTKRYAHHHHGSRAGVDLLTLMVAQAAMLQVASGPEGG